jgi:hypothetical protein
MLVSPRVKIMVWVSGLILCFAGAAIVFQREIRVAYHRNRMFAAMENHGLMTGQTRMATVLEHLRFGLLSMSSVEDSVGHYGNP